MAMSVVWKYHIEVTYFSYQVLIPDRKNIISHNYIQMKLVHSNF